MRSCWLCCCCAPKKDAEDYYKEQIKLLKRKITDKKAEAKNKNIGLGFAVFSDEKIVKDFKLMQKDFFMGLY